RPRRVRARAVRARGPARGAPRRAPDGGALAVRRPPGRAVAARYVAARRAVPAWVRDRRAAEPNQPGGAALGLRRARPTEVPGALRRRRGALLLRGAAREDVLGVRRGPHRSPARSRVPV